jgi:polynucleotide 5'-hydroxyl-kinase GRC3/NOL9
MKMVMDPSKGLLIRGPSSLTMLRGSIEIVGFPLRPRREIIIREGLTLPILFLKKSSIDVTLGEGADLREVAGPLIPPSWDAVVEEVLAKGFKTMLVMGGTDSGKTTFCVYASNRLVKKLGGIAIIDGDIGQSDIGPPATVSMGLIKDYIIDMFSVKPFKMHFVGAISPRGVTGRVITSVKSLLKLATTNLTIINTDGWIEGGGAVSYKTLLLEAVKPQCLVYAQKSSELKPIVKEANKRGIKTLSIDPPKTMKKRSEAERKFHRELSYKKFLKNAKLRLIPFKDVEIKGSLFGVGAMAPSRDVKRYQRFLKKSILYVEENPSAILLLLKDAKSFPTRKIQEMKESVGKEVLLLKSRLGFLVWLSSDGKSGIGSLFDIDYDRNVFKVYTEFDDAVKELELSCLRVDKNGKEHLPLIS